MISLVTKKVLKEDINMSKCAREDGLIDLGKTESIEAPKRFTVIWLVAGVIREEDKFTDV